MSIVEKALKKLQIATSSAPEARVQKPPRSAAPPAPRPLPDAARSALAVPIVVPKHTITIDFRALQSAGLVVPDELVHPFLDQYRRVKWPVLAGAFGSPEEVVPRGNLVMVTSSLPSEGKTFLSVNLGLSIASERDCKLLLVDADVAKRHLTKLLGLDRAPGLLDLLAPDKHSIDDVLVGSDLDQLMILPAGVAKAQAPELLASRRMELVAQELATRFADHIVLFDSSPLLLTNESQVLSKLVGQVLLVVRANHTPQAAILEAIGLLDQRARTSCVLNQVAGGMLKYGYSEYPYYENK